MSGDVVLGMAGIPIYQVPTAIIAAILGGCLACVSYLYICRTGVVFANSLEQLAKLTDRPPVTLSTGVVTGLLWGLTVHRYGIGLQGVFVALLAWLLVLISVIDLQTHLIPNRLLVACLIPVTLALLAGFVPWRESILGSAFYGGILWLAALISRGGLGGGDVKLGALLGLALGWQWGLVALCVTLVAAAAVGGMLILSKRINRRDFMAFGPFMAAGALAALFWGSEIVSWYLRR